MRRNRRRSRCATRALLLSLSLTSAALAGVSEAALAQIQEAPTLRVGKIDSEVRLDGRLEDEVWGSADSIATLTMTEPVEGGDLVGRTTVRVLASPEELLIGIVAYDPDPAGIVSVSKRAPGSGRSWAAAQPLQTSTPLRTAALASFMLTPGG